MHINHDDIVALATSDQSDKGGVNLLASMDRELNTLLSQVCSDLLLLVERILSNILLCDSDSSKKANR